MLFLLMISILELVEFLSHPVHAASASHQFRPLSTSRVISYQKMQNILIDFEHKETLIRRSSVLVTEQMKFLYEELQLQAASPPFHYCTRLLQGPSGAGKSTVLLVLGHIARESGCLVFPIEARQFAIVNDHELKNNILLFMTKWIRATGEDILRSHKCITKPTLTLLEFVNEGLNWQGTC
jgi:ABC-type transport system involved in cytochrome bd biosynthesis fused ATPase/permease subunit